MGNKLAQNLFLMPTLKCLQRLEGEWETLIFKISSKSVMESHNQKKKKFEKEQSMILAQGNKNKKFQVSRV